MSPARSQRGRQLERLLPKAIELNRRWEERFGPAPDHPALEPHEDRLDSAWDELEQRLGDSYPFFHPRFAGQMLKPPHPAAAAAYLAAMLVNPNNHALDGGPATSEMEREVAGELAAMLHLPPDALGHLTSSGTIANLEALWVARELHPGKAVAYGCGAVLFRDPAVGSLYEHDSPYTYFSSDEPHLGEISLECSRAGAAAAALWMTLRALPLAPGDGLGPILKAGLSAARAFAGLLSCSDSLRLHVQPELDIVTYFPAADGASAADVDAACARVLEAGASDPADPVHLSTLRVDGARFARLHPGYEADCAAVRVLRSVLMKPEHELTVPWLHERVSALSAAG